MMRDSQSNVLLRDLRNAVAKAVAVGIPDPYQRAHFRVLGQRAYNGFYVALDWTRIDDADTLDFGQTVLERLANLERMG